MPVDGRRCCCCWRFKHWHMKRLKRHENIHSTFPIKWNMSQYFDKFPEILITCQTEKRVVGLELHSRNKELSDVCNKPTENDDKKPRVTHTHTHGFIWLFLRVSPCGNETWVSPVPKRRRQNNWISPGGVRASQTQTLNKISCPETQEQPGSRKCRVWHTCEFRCIKYRVNERVSEPKVFRMSRT